MKNTDIDGAALCQISVTFGSACANLPTGLEQHALEKALPTYEAVYTLLRSWHVAFRTSELGLEGFFGKKFRQLVKESLAAYIADCVSQNAGAITLVRPVEVKDETKPLCRIEDLPRREYTVTIKDPASGVVSELSLLRTKEAVMELTWYVSEEYIENFDDLTPFVQAMWIGYRDKILKEITDENA